MTPGPKPTVAINNKNVRPGGGRTRHHHQIPPLPLEPPAELGADGAVLYREIVAGVAYGQLAAIDLPLLTVFVAHVLIHRLAVTQMNALKELVVETASTTKPHPLLDIANDQAKAILDLADALGLTPGSRARLKLPAAPAGIGVWDSIS